jgi:hypothetical protein
MHLGESGRRFARAPYCVKVHLRHSSSTAVVKASGWPPRGRTWRAPSTRSDRARGRGPASTLRAPCTRSRRLPAPPRRDRRRRGAGSALGQCPPSSCRGGAHRGCQTRRPARLRAPPWSRRGPSSSDDPGPPAWPPVRFFGRALRGARWQRGGARVLLGPGTPRNEVVLRAGPALALEAQLLDVDRSRCPRGGPPPVGPCNSKQDQTDQDDTSHGGPPR